MGQKICVYGGQFGSEGKGSFAEWYIKERMAGRKLLVIGENSPNSGHTNTVGKTRSLPVSAYFADEVLLGPDAAVDPWLLLKEIEAIRLHQNRVNSSGQQVPVLKIHQQAALITGDEVISEKNSGIMERIGSTVTGGGQARVNKALHRERRFTIGHFTTTEWQVLDQQEYDELLIAYDEWDWLFECSQGMMLDLNLGYYPFVTSRSTHPRVAIERNGLGHDKWQYIGVFRTYPIRTGGNSGHTAGKEVSWDTLGLQAEIATVTKRQRRVFEFSGGDFLRSIRWVRPHAVAFTHLDYLRIMPGTLGVHQEFKQWLIKGIYGCDQMYGHKDYSHIPFYLSDTPGYFHPAGPLLF